MLATHLTESQSASGYDLPGSRFEVPLQLGVDGSRADGLMKHRIEGSSTPEIAKPARPFTYSSADVLEVVFAGTVRAKRRRHDDGAADPFAIHSSQSFRSRTAIVALGMMWPRAYKCACASMM